jgi:hypothetical protein
MTVAFPPLDRFISRGVQNKVKIIVNMIELILILVSHLLIIFTYQD